MTDGNFANLIHAAAEAIGLDGEIPYPFRRALRSALRGLAGDQPAWRWLELICAQKTAPIWRVRFPDENAPIALAAAAERQLLSGVVSVSSDQLATVKTFLDDKFQLGEEAFPAIYAGFACWAAARSTYFNSEPSAYAISEQGLAPEEWDASFMASLACAGGAVWEQGVGSATLRREFWLWFLAEAVPQARARMT